MNSKIFYIFFAICLLLAIASFVLMFTNPKLYCKIALYGNINSVPAICLKEAISELKNQ